VLALADRQIVVDAGANALFEVQNRQVTLLAVLPQNEGRHSVPTSIALGPDGNYYVGEFGGEGDGPINGQSRVFKVTPEGDVSVFAEGFTAVTGVAFGPDGALYVTQWSDDLSVEQPSGSVVRVAGDGSRTSFGQGELFFPSGAAFGADGALYVSNWSILPANTPQNGPFGGANGQLVKLDIGVTG
jgi:sugar lactone lactonase YvrE